MPFFKSQFSVWIMFYHNQAYGEKTTQNEMKSY